MGATGGGAGGPSQAEADADLNALMGVGDEDDKKKGGMNFLIALAEAMGKTQGRFLEMALAEQRKMEGLVDTIEAETNNGEDGSEKPGGTSSAQAFTTAQSKFSAYMQMFNLYSNQVATGIKTIGEALSAIARKQ